MAEITAKMVADLRKSTGAGMMDCKKALSEANGDFDEAVRVLREKGQAKAAKRLGNETKEGRMFAKVSECGKTAAMISLTCETEPVAGVTEFVSFGEKVIETVFNNEDLSIHDAELTEIRAALGENITIKENIRMEGDLVESYIHTNKKVGVLLTLSIENNEMASNDDVKELAKNLTLQIASLAPKSVGREDLDPKYVEEEKEILIVQLKEDPKNANKPREILEKIVEGRLGKIFAEACLLEQEYVKEKMQVRELVESISKKVGTTVKVEKFVRYQIGG
ncbi:MAG: translation elongation factor Ts [Candidatus Delongbacteria bacterium]|nr:translation elongation factor Ts [Candidatus Delongbacteria bacterium]MBN2835847.1 translation elongation factor Ts [Candidatus Delongbacteria bacterium]